MAGDWIKMRNELWTHPKFICLSNLLAYKEDNYGFASYVLGEEVNTHAYLPSNEKVTDVLLRTVTKRVLRDVTMCSLLRVWCAVNAHAKVVDNDAVCHPMGLSDLDEIAGFDGFGEALEASGWVVSDEERDSLVFKNFCEFNEPAFLRKKPAKSNAERQAEFRARRKEKNGVTKSNESNAREEKRREDISITDVIDKKSKKFDPVSHLVSLGVNNQVAIDYCQQRKKKPTLTALQGIAAQAAKANMSIEKALRICCSRGWEGFKAEWVAEKPIPVKTTGKFAAAAASYTTIFPQEEINDGRIIDITPRLG